MTFRGTVRMCQGALGRHITALCIAVASGATAFSVPAIASEIQAEDRQVTFNIGTQPLQDALLAYSEQAGVQIILPPAIADEKIRRGVTGRKSIYEALSLLVLGTGYEFRFTAANTVVVQKRIIGKQAEIGELDVERPRRQSLVARRIQKREEALYLEELVTVGTRNPSRTITETAVPVDVIGESALRRNGYTQTGRLIQALAPSFNFTETTISDGTDIVRPATLRGLGPDQVLVLVNGKRRHSQSWVNVQNTVGKGSIGTDMNTIPIGAIKRVEILRDGAAAQYGSDAIAGVVNIVLKDNDHGLSGDASWGQTYEGDGDTFSASATVGLPLGEDGFVNITADYQNRQETNRADPSSITGDVVMRIGETDVEATSVMWNMALPNTSGSELYAFGGLTKREGLSGGFYRHIHQAARSVPQLYPEGFLPLQRTDVSDFSHAFGFRHQAENGWQFDLSGTYGRTRFAFGAEHTVNVSRASAAFYSGLDPVQEAVTEGFSGALEFQQFTANLDVAGASQFGDMAMTHAFGFEFRDELYSIEAGDPASYDCGTIIGGELAPSILDPDVIAVCGFQGFPGYSDEVAGKQGRSSYAIYLDTEFEPANNWFFTVAARFEDFGGTGSKLTGKVSTRYQASENVALRGAISTGFRAPALAQRAFTSVITNTSAEGLTQTLVAPEGHVIPMAYGVEKLRHETNRNISFGAVWNAAENLKVTLDAYRIDISDRIVLGPTLPIPEGLELGAIEAGSFFSNAVDTRTLGIDFVTTYNTLLAKGDLRLTGSVSWNKTKIMDVNAPQGVAPEEFFPFAEQVNVERSQPHFRATTTADYQRGAFGFLVRVNFYGNAQSAFYTAPGNNIPEDIAVDVYGIDYRETISSGAAAIFDLELSYDLTENITVALGGNNIFDTYPDRLPNNSLSRWISEGRMPGAFGNFRYPWVVMPWGIRGGYYYARMSFEF